jgi:hypothetical protein
MAHRMFPSRLPLVVPRSNIERAYNEILSERNYWKRIADDRLKRAKRAEAIPSAVDAFNAAMTGTFVTRPKGKINLDD